MIVLRGFLPVLVCATLTSCSYFGNRPSLDIVDETHWMEINEASQSDEYVLYSDGDTLNVVHTDYGRLLSVGPPYLPIIPAAASRAKDSTWRLFVALSPSKDRKLLEQDLRFVADDTVELKATFSSLQEECSTCRESFITATFRGQIADYKQIVVHLRPHAAGSPPAAVAPLVLKVNRRFYLRHQLGS